MRFCGVVGISSFFRLLLEVSGSMVMKSEMLESSDSRAQRCFERLHTRNSTPKHITDVRANPLTRKNPLIDIFFLFESVLLAGLSPTSSLSIRRPYLISTPTRDR
ncbi:hypothetical protein EDB92DRAFT_555813 [Lactarius akahatsu]|uniref:Secreted protein n=1 Tax=Lactarius akahatsu TaxID=416441 RepID=A0AAD4L3R8_9AGAM|nr:hypothetical protein EDB92DRAFT_555813 [Lactarius akahatsu]